MKNPHQAGAKNSRAAQSKQARTSADQTLLAAPVKTKEQRPRLKTVQVWMPKALAEAVAQATRDRGITKSEFLRIAIKNKIQRSDAGQPVRTNGPKGGAR